MPFDPAELAPALPDVIAAIGIAFVFAVITFKARSASPPSVDETVTAIQFTQEQLAKQQQSSSPAPSEEDS